MKKYEVYPYYINMYFFGKSKTKLGAKKQIYSQIKKSLNITYDECVENNYIENNLFVYQKKSDYYVCEYYFQSKKQIQFFYDYIIEIICCFSN